MFILKVAYCTTIPKLVLGSLLGRVYVNRVLNDEYLISAKIMSVVTDDEMRSKYSASGSAQDCTLRR